MAGVPGRSGRRPKPTEQKLLAGNPGGRALNEAQPDFGTITNIDPPDWIERHARDMWERIVPLLCGQRVLQETDIHNVEVFCNAYGNWRDAQEEVSRHGITVTGAQGGVIKNPALSALNEAVRQMTVVGAYLGLDPSSRQRISSGLKKQKANPFGALLGGGDGG